MITQKKWLQLEAWMQNLGIQDSDLEEQFIIGSGRGGQNLQKTNSCVLLKYKPIGLIIKCQQSRLRESNRYFARRRLCEKIDTLQNKAKSQKQQEIAKIRQQKRRRSRRAKQKLLQDKRHQSKIKKDRKKPGLDL